MITVEQFIKQYETDKNLQAEVAKILKDGKVSVIKLMSFAKKHGVKISIKQIPQYMEQLRKAGLID